MALITPAVAQDASIVLTKTVGLDPEACATSPVLTITNPTLVYYCYEVLNTGNLTLTVHDLVDTQLGTLLSAHPYALAPGASVYITEAATIAAQTVNTATWTATAPGIGSDASSATAVVNFQLVNIPLLSRSGLAVLLLLVAGAGLLLLRRSA